jgi:hypothetical protein
VTRKEVVGVFVRFSPAKEAGSSLDLYKKPLALRLGVLILLR